MNKSIENITEVDNKTYSLEETTLFGVSTLMDVTTTPAPTTEDTSERFILIPLCVLFGILILSAVVYLMARNRRRLAHIYCKRKYASRYKYDDKDDEDSDVALLRGDDEDPTECLLTGKLQIDNRYQSTNVGQSTSSSIIGELYT